jgi:plastocyanin
MSGISRVHRTPVVAALLAAGIGLLGACSSSGGGTTGQAAQSGSAASTSSAAASGSGMASAGTATMSIKGFAFTTPPTVSPGATVEVTNNDGETHTVTADEGSAFDVTVPAGKTATFTAPSAPGRYAFHCNFHSNMQGVLVVQ